MDTFNRLFMAALALGALVVSVVVLLVAADVVSPAGVSADGWLRDQVQEIDQLGGDSKTATILAVVAALIAAVVLLVLEVRPLLTVDQMILADFGGKEFGIYADSIKQLIVRAGQEIDGVVAVTPSIRKGADGLRISCQATLVPSANMPEVSSQLQEKIKAFVEGLAGATVADVRVTLRYKPERPRRRGRVS